MSYLRSQFALLVASSLMGCAPNADEFAQADFGAYPANSTQIVDQWLVDHLVDPDSRKVKFTAGPEKYFWRFSSPHYGYVVCGNVNSRNRMGGYSGASSFYAIIHDGVVVSAGIRELDDSVWLAPPICIPS